MQTLSVYIVFGVVIGSGCVKYQPFLLILVVTEYYFKMKALGVEYFGLQEHKRLRYLKAMFPEVLRERQFCGLVSAVHVALHRLVECSLHWSL